MTDSARERRTLYSDEGLAVETYDQQVPAPDQGPTAGDREFYIDLARASDGPVLELGAGTGRVTLALADKGFDVVGLDLSQPMLRRAEDKCTSRPMDARQRIKFVIGDMENFDLEERFGLVVCPDRAFLRMLSPDAQRRCLECIHRHLKPDGRVALHLFDPRHERLVPGSAAEQKTSEFYHPDSKNVVKLVVEFRHVDLVNQIQETNWLYEEIDKKGATIRREETNLTLRWSYRWEMRHLLERCGFKIEAEYSDFKRSPPAYGQEQVWVARRS